MSWLNTYFVNISAGFRLSDSSQFLSSYFNNFVSARSDTTCSSSQSKMCSWAGIFKPLSTETYSWFVLSRPVNRQTVSVNSKLFSTVVAPMFRVQTSCIPYCFIPSLLTSWHASNRWAAMLSEISQCLSRASVAIVSEPSSMVLAFLFLISQPTSFHIQLTLTFPSITNFCKAIFSITYLSKRI